MGFEGISNPGRILPEHQLAEAASLGAFHPKIEQNAASKVIKNDEESKKDQETEDENENEGEEYVDTYESEEQPQPVVSEVKAVGIKTIDFTIRFNKYTELVELIHINDNRVMHSIPPKDLIQLISELKFTSGVFVDNEA